MKYIFTYLFSIIGFVIGFPFRIMKDIAGLLIFIFSGITIQTREKLDKPRLKTLKDLVKENDERGK